MTERKEEEKKKKEMLESFSKGCECFYNRHYFQKYSKDCKLHRKECGEYLLGV